MISYIKEFAVLARSVSYLFPAKMLSLEKVETIFYQFPPIFHLKKSHRNMSVCKQISPCISLELDFCDLQVRQVRLLMKGPILVDQVVTVAVAEIEQLLSLLTIKCPVVFTVHHNDTELSHCLAASMLILTKRLAGVSLVPVYVSRASCL